MADISTIDPIQLSNLYNKIKAVSKLQGDSYVYSGDENEILEAMKILHQFGFGEGNKIPNFDTNAPWEDW